MLCNSLLTVTSDKAFLNIGWLQVSHECNVLFLLPTLFYSFCIDAVAEHNQELNIENIIKPTWKTNNPDPTINI